MNPLQRNNVTVAGHRAAGRTMLFAHGFGCDQTMWSRITGAFAPEWQLVLMDYVGAGATRASDFNPVRYGSLAGYARDVIEVIDALALSEVVFVGHSVSAMIGALAAIERPELFSRLVMIAPNPCYIDDGDWRGGFARADIDDLLGLIDRDYAAWAHGLAPVIMGNAERPELAAELEASFCRTDPRIASQFARVTFLSDSRADMAAVTRPALVMQCAQDAIAPDGVGEWLAGTLPAGTLVRLRATGHCPQVSAPAETIDVMRRWLAG